MGYLNLEEATGSVKIAEGKLDVNNMTILVTGGSKGLGYKIVKNLSKNKNNYIYTTYNKTFPKYFEKLENVELLQVDFVKMTL